MANILITMLLSVIVSFLPVMVASIPLLFLRKSQSIKAGIYKRGFMAFFVFWMLYFLLPSGINLITEIISPSGQYWENIILYELSEGEFSTEWDVTNNLGILFNYLFQLTVNSYILFIQYPIQILPFVFVISPIVAFAIIIYRLKDEDKDKSFKQKLDLIQYDIETSPGEQIQNRLAEKGWKTERELFKILLSLLPISLYLLMTILRLLQFEEQSSILKGTSLGWFLEMFFAYLAVIIFSVHLLAAGGLSYKGIYVGRRIREALFQSLSTVGFLVSAVAILLFIIEYSNQLFTVVYFAAYFIMTTIFFVLFLDILEPLSIFFLTKIIEFAKAKHRGTILHSVKKIAGIVVLSLIINVVLSLMDFSLRVFMFLFLGETRWLSLPVFLFYHAFIALAFLLILATSTSVFRRWNWNSLTNSYMVFIGAFIFGLLWFIWYPVLGYNGANGTMWPGYVPGDLYLQPTLITTFLTTTEGSTESWLTSIFRYGFFDGSFFVVPEIYEVSVNFAPILGLLALPFRILHGFSTIVLFGLLFFYINRKFVVYTTRVESDDDKDNIREKTVYSARDVSPEMSAVLSNPNNYIVMRNFEDYPPEGEEPPDFNENDPKYDMVNNICQFDFGETVVEYTTDEEPISFEELSDDSKMTLEQIVTFMNTIGKSALSDSKIKPFTILQKEYGFTYEEVTLDSLHVMMTDGRSVFMHNFTEESKVEPALVSGLFAAITSFAKEAVQSEELLRTIDHGDVVLMIEYGKYVFTAIFAEDNSATIRKKLRDFLDEFETIHTDDLIDWLGDLSPFMDDTELVEKYFEQAQN